MSEQTTTPEVDQTLELNNEMTERRSKLAALRATPCLWVAAQDQFETLTIFGFYRDFNIDISYPSVCYCTAEFEGLS